MSCGSACSAPGAPARKTAESSCPAGRSASFTLDDFVLPVDGELAERAHRRDVLGRSLAPAQVIELESSRSFYGLAERSLFE